MASATCGLEVLGSKGKLGTPEGQANKQHSSMAASAPAPPFPEGPCFTRIPSPTSSDDGPLPGHTLKVNFFLPKVLFTNYGDLSLSQHRNAN